MLHVHLTTMARALHFKQNDPTLPVTHEQYGRAADDTHSANSTRSPFCCLTTSPKSSPYSHVCSGKTCSILCRAQFESSSLVAQMPSLGPYDAVPACAGAFDVRKTHALCLFRNVNTMCKQSHWSTTAHRGGWLFSLFSCLREQRVFPSCSFCATLVSCACCR